MSQSVMFFAIKNRDLLSRPQSRARWKSRRLFHGVALSSRKRISSSLRKMFTNRRTLPFSSQIRSLMPG